MPLINSHNKPLYNPGINNDKVVTNNMDSIVNDIIRDLINKHASLIYDIDAGKDSDPLEKEILKLTDHYRKRYLLDSKYVFKSVYDYLFGYGILQDYINDESISDIDFTRYNYGTIKRNGIKEVCNLAFNDEKEFENYCKLLIIRNGGIINENDSHCRVADEKYRLRINVAIPPRNRTGASLIIRKHRMNPYNLDELESLGMLTSDQSLYLRSIASNLDNNFLICGKGASGKTTLLRAMLMEVNSLNNILVCEKDTELYLNELPNFIIQKIKKDEEGGKEVTLKDLVRDGLTMSIDGICVGEMVSNEAWDFINAGYTDHKICATLHAKSPEDSIERLITMIDTANLNLPETTIKKIIKGSIKVIIYLRDFKVHSIKRIIDYNKDSDQFVFD